MPAHPGKRVCVKGGGGRGKGGEGEGEGGRGQDKQCNGREGEEQEMTVGIWSTLLPKNDQNLKLIKI